MKRMVFSVLLAVFVCCSITVACSDLAREQGVSCEVSEQLKQQTEFDELQWKLARWYNLNLTAEYQEQGFEDAYWDILDLEGHAMGYVTVPSRGICLPICHGIGQLNSVGHIRSTAFPIGGLGTHTALTGAFYLEKGECFYIHILGQVRPYRVCETETAVDGGIGFPVYADAELCTLVNAGSDGTVRLMRGSFWEEAPGEETVRVEEHRESDGWQIAACIVFALGILLVPFLMWCRER